MSSPPWNSSACCRHRAVRRPCQTPQRPDRAQKNRLIQCVGSRGRLHRPGILLLRVLHVRRQAVHHRQRARPRGYAHHFASSTSGRRARVLTATTSGPGDEHGVRLIRSMISRVTEDPRTHNLELTYVDEDGQIRMEEFDMVVLSVGLRPIPGAQKLAAVWTSTTQPGFDATFPMRVSARGSMRWSSSVAKCIRRGRAPRAAGAGLPSRRSGDP